MDNPETQSELEDICSLWKHPLTESEKALRWKSGCNYLDEMQFMEWTVKNRRIKWMEKRIALLETSPIKNE
jgi:hypothetical protein